MEERDREREALLIHRWADKQAAVEKKKRRRRERRRRRRRTRRKQALAKQAGDDDEEEEEGVDEFGTRGKNKKEREKKRFTRR